MIPEVLSQHIEEAAVQWMMRDDAVFRPHYSLTDLADLDYRVENHRDGIRIAGNDCWQLCMDELEWESAGEVFAAATIALEHQNADHIAEIRNVALSNYELSRGLVSAIAWLDGAKAIRWIEKLMADDDPAARRVGLASAAVNRIDVKKWLLPTIDSDDIELKKRALQAAGELGRSDVLRFVEANFAHEDPGIRYHALTAGRLLGHSHAADPLLELSVELEGWQAKQAVILAIRSNSISTATEAFKKFTSLNQDHGLNAVAVGAIGDPAMIDWLIKLMDVDELARVAGESFSLITGVDISEDDLERDLPESPDDQPEPDGDEDLPCPDPDLVKRWWQQNRSNFSAGQRYLLGQPLDSTSVKHALVNGKQRQRSAAALEFALGRPESSLFETRMPGFQQQKKLT